MLLRGVLAFVLLSLLGYGFAKGYPLISGPNLRIDMPTAYGTVSSGVVVVSGRAAYTEILTLNGRPILIDEQERFSETFALPGGSAILTLMATDRFGREVTKQRMVYIP